jgi:hypothetical protein
MAYKILGQKCPTNTAEFAFPAVPNGVSWLVSTIALTNITATAATATVNICADGAASSNDNTLVKTLSIPALSMVPLTLGVTLDAADVIRVTSGTTSAITFQIFGQEV